MTEIELLIEKKINELLNPTVEIVSTKPIPTSASEYSAGYDIQANLQNIQEKFLKNAEIMYENDQITGIKVNPNGKCLVPTGIFTSFPGRYEVQIRSRSGNALKYEVIVLNEPGTIEGDYKNEWGVIIKNLGTDAFIIKDGDKICQAVFSLVVRPNFVRVNKVDDLSGTDRGGGFGHSGR